MNPRNRKPINRGSPSVAAPPGVPGAGTPLPGRTGQADELKELLAFERAAMLEARSTEHVMQKKLAEAQAGRGKPGEAARSAMGRAKAPRNRDQPSSALMRAQWERAQKDLERAQVSHDREAEQTEAKLTQLREALKIAQEAGASESQELKRRAQIRILSGVAATVVVGVVIFAVIQYLHRGLSSTPESHAAVERAVEAAPAGVIGQAGAQSEFTQGISRLGRAFSRFPGVDPETIMRAVNKKAASSGSSVCAFAWNDGQPALQFGDQRGGNNSLAATLSRCADAVEKFR